MTKEQILLTMCRICKAEERCRRNGCQPCMAYEHIREVLEAVEAEDANRCASSESGVIRFHSMSAANAYAYRRYGCDFKVINRGGYYYVEAF